MAAAEEDGILERGCNGRRVATSRARSVIPASVRCYAWLGLSIRSRPQFWNVLKGEMSIVGPRPPLPSEVRQYERWQRRRLSMRPGITCVWQISGRSDIDFDQWMDLDLEYIDNWSLWADLKIFFKTIPVVLIGRGAR